jgi:hypothetical protein
VKIYDIPKDTKLYNSGSSNQWKALELLGIFPIDAFVSKKTNRLIKVYILTDEVADFLVKWSANKSKKGVE